MALAPNGTLYELNHYGQIYALPQSGTAASWQTVLNTADPDCLAVTMALTPNGTLYELNHYGQIYALPQGGTAASWQTVLNTTATDCLAVTMALAPNGTLYELNHYSQIYALPQGGSWQIVGDDVRSFAFGSDGQLIVTTSYNRNPTAAVGYSPAPANAPLFNNGQPSYLDVEQGQVGDCWLEASLAEVAARDPQDIKNMFTYDGTTVDNGATVGLYTVRFYSTGGSAVYILVDTELPSGGEYYDHVANDLGTQALWVALAEKAYAEANGLGYVTTGARGVDSYGALNGGWPSWALQAITGEPATRYSTNPTNIASAWNAGDLIVLDTTNPTSSAIVGEHCYAVVGYNASSGEPFEAFNPWGTQANGWAPGETGKIYGLFTANAAFISQNFAGQTIGVGAMDVNAIDGAVEELTDLATLSNDADPSGTFHSTRHRLTGRVVGVTTALGSPRPVTGNAGGTDR
jgi:hypothetical protein